MVKTGRHSLKYFSIDLLKINKDHQVMKRTYFERAIFLSWYCENADCKFCYMSTQKGKANRLAKRKPESIYAEAHICREMNWPVGFLSGGHGVYDYDNIKEITKNVYEITGQEQWMNIGVLSRETMKGLKPYIKGVTGSVETVDEELHDELCPSKPLEPIIKMFREAKELGLRRAMTLIIGLGENIEDFPKLKRFIEDNDINKIVIYALNPIKGTMFTEGPDIDYFIEWIRKTRDAFPDLEIVAGVWTSRLDRLKDILEAGPDNITKLPIWKVMDTGKAEKIKEEMKKAGRDFASELERKPVKAGDNKIQEKIDQYIKL